jgi:hypothetical protein
MRTRRTPVVVGVLATLLLAGCGSPSAPVATERSRNSQQVTGTSPSPSTRTPGLSSSAATTPVAPAGTAPADTSSEGIVTESTTPTFAVVDQTTGDYVVGQGRSAVLLEIGIRGVGRAWTVNRMGVRQTPDGTSVHYEGRGQLDPKARFGGRIPPLAGASPVDPRPAHLRVDLLMTPDGLGHADVWIDGRRHRVTGTEPPHTADPVVSAVVEAMRTEDWSAMYDLTVRLPGMTRADFMKTFGSEGTIESLELTGDTVYRVTGGMAYADAPAHIAATIGKRHLDRDGAVELIYREGKWRFSSFAKGIDGN